MVESNKDAKNLLKQIEELVESHNKDAGDVRSIIVIASCEKADINLMRLDTKELPYVLGLLDINKNNVLKATDEVMGDNMVMEEGRATEEKLDEVRDKIKAAMAQLEKDMGLDAEH